MGLIFMIMLGAVLGWVATIILRGANVRELAINMVVGIGGGLIAGLLVCPLIGKDNLLSSGHSVEALLVSLAGSLILLVSVNVLRRGEMR